VRNELLSIELVVRIELLVKIELLVRVELLATELLVRIELERMWKVCGLSRDATPSFYCRD
jgi:hypothetical protein